MQPRGLMALGISGILLVCAWLLLVFPPHLVTYWGDVLKIFLCLSGATFLIIGIFTENKEYVDWPWVFTMQGLLAFLVAGTALVVFGIIYYPLLTLIALIALVVVCWLICWLSSIGPEDLNQEQSDVGIADKE